MRGRNWLRCLGLRLRCVLFCVVCRWPRRGWRDPLLGRLASSGLPCLGGILFTPSVATDKSKPERSAFSTSALRHLVQHGKKCKNDRRAHGNRVTPLEPSLSPSSRHASPSVSRTRNNHPINSDDMHSAIQLIISRNYDIVNPHHHHSNAKAWQHSRSAYL